MNGKGDYLFPKLALTVAGSMDEHRYATSTDAVANLTKEEASRASLFFTSCMHRLPHGRNNPAFMAAAAGGVVMKECGFTPKREIPYTRTSVKRIRTAFPTRTKRLTDPQILELRRDDTAFKNFVYNGLNGNGSTPHCNDGKVYEGRGLVQLTGRGNYSSIATITGLDLLGHPELVLHPAHCSEIAIALLNRDLKTVMSRQIDLWPPGSDLVELAKAVTCVYLAVAGPATDLNLLMHRPFHQEGIARTFHYASVLLGLYGDIIV